MPRNSSDSERKISSTVGLTVFASVFVTSILVLGYVYFNFPELEESEKQFIKLPTGVDDLKNLANILNKHKDKHFLEVLLAVFVTYIFLQTFAIPGSISLSILSGFLFPFGIAITLVCFCSATGASLCYLISNSVGRQLVLRYFPDKVNEYSAKVKKHRDNIFNYILILRITPIVPNWFINLAAPIVDVPIIPFYFGTFLGVALPSFFAIQAGQSLHELTSASGTLSWTSVCLLFLGAFLAALPIVFRNALKKKLD